MIGHETNKNMLLFDLLSGNSNLFHFMTTRTGGVSQGEYDSFNLGEFAGDHPADVAENRKRLASSIGVEALDLVFPYQTHEDKVLQVDEAFLSLPSEERKQAAAGYDALVTHVPGICIGVTTADCVPLIAYDPVQKVLAAIHAGWRGTVACIVPKTIRLMVEEYGCLPATILVGIGACISPEKFEVGEEVVDAFRFAGMDLSNASFRNPATGKCHIDLQAVNKQLLLSEGILPENIEIMPLCTQTRADLFFSARRQGVKSGRMVTGGVLK
ncbi:MAG: hypothetical protein H6Q14_2832 [Bacteroidetes bacterium]|nr:hypothetical protein [Bacteroidota bacterium]